MIYFPVFTLKQSSRGWGEGKGQWGRELYVDSYWSWVMGTWELIILFLIYVFEIFHNEKVPKKKKIGVSWGQHVMWWMVRTMLESEGKTEPGVRGGGPPSVGSVPHPSEAAAPEEHSPALFLSALHTALKVLSYKMHLSS